MGVELVGLEEEALDSREVGNLGGAHPGRRDLSAVPVPRSPRGSPPPPLWHCQRGEVLQDQEIRRTAYASRSSTRQHVH